MSAPKIGGPEWSRIVTASKMAAIIGVSPWESPYSCWMQMKGLASREQNQAMRRGTYLEAGILAWWRDQHGIADPREYREQAWYPHDHWAGATVDLVTHTGEGDLEYDGDEQRIIVEAKSAARMDEWGDPGTDAIPAYYLTQVYFQLAVSGAERCYVPVIGPYLDFSEYVVERDDEIQADLLHRARVFYDSLASDVPPPLDSSVATYDVVRKLHPDIDKGAAVELDFDDACLYLNYSRDVKEAIEADREQKSRLLTLMGSAQYATYDGVTIARRQPNKHGVSLVPLLKNISVLNPKEAA